MIGAIDYIGLSALVSATCAGIASIIAARNARATHREVKLPPPTNGATAKTTGEAIAEVVASAEPWDGTDRRTPPGGTPVTKG